jgi:hypothetical protein
MRITYGHISTSYRPIPKNINNRLGLGNLHVGNFFFPFLSKKWVLHENFNIWHWVGRITYLMYSPLPTLGKEKATQQNIPK